jgi:2-polyprenyl-3-methyl-5-hydroxy-6-metoxy-1,4-benzoquinol methylase
VKLEAKVQVSSYFEFTRTEIASLLPATANRILEIGCGHGNTLRWLKEIYPTAETVGVEYWPRAREQLCMNADLAIIADLEQPLPEELTGQFDLILALDVLEHLRHPSQVLGNVLEHLSPTGHVIVSLPNISHISVTAPLLFRRQFRFTEAGVMDRTHLRWFTEENAVGLLNEVGLRVSDGVVNGPDGRKLRMLDMATFGLFRHWLTKQYIMLGERGVGQTPVRWRIPRA